MRRRASSRPSLCGRSTWIGFCIAVKWTAVQRFSSFAHSLRCPHVVDFSTFDRNFGQRRGAGRLLGAPAAGVATERRLCHPWPGRAGLSQLVRPRQSTASASPASTITATYRVATRTKAMLRTLRLAALRRPASGPRSRNGEYRPDLRYINDESCPRSDRSKPSLPLAIRCQQLDEVRRKSHKHYRDRRGPLRPTSARAMHAVHGPCARGLNMASAVSSFMRSTATHKYRRWGADGGGDHCRRHTAEDAGGVTNHPAPRGRLHRLPAAHCAAAILSETGGQRGDDRDATERAETARAAGTRPGPVANPHWSAPTRR